MDRNDGEDEEDDVSNYRKTSRSRRDWRTFERGRAQTAYKFGGKKKYLACPWAF
jgi:hypothetical protein